MAKSITILLSSIKMTLCQQKTMIVKRYSKIPKMSPGAYIFQRPFFEGLIFGGAYVRREICVSKSIKLALFLEGNLLFLIVLLCI